MSDSTTIVCVVSNSWRDPALAVAGDTPRMRRYRELQSRWRETVLGLPPGVHSTGRVVGSLLPDSAPEDAQWLTPIIADHVRRRVPEVAQERGAMELDRLRRNLLSSQPLCFNVFGQLSAYPDTAARVWSQLLDMDLAGTADVRVEHAPPEAAARMGDRSAFDASFRADGTSGQLFVGVETKYTEPFSARQYDGPAYRQATDHPDGWFYPGAGDIAKGSLTNQLWRTLLLAQLTEHLARPQTPAVVVVLTAGEDEHARAAVAGVRPLLHEPDRRLRHLFLEDLVAVARGEHDLRAWAHLFHARYLDV